MKIKSTFVILSIISITYNGIASDTHELIEHSYNNAIFHNLGKVQSFSNKAGEWYTTPEKPSQAQHQSVLIYTDEVKSLPFENEGQLEKVLKKVIPLQDGRERIISTNTWPYSIHVNLNIEYSNGHYGGSGIMVGPHHILTAAHNVYDYDKKWALKVHALPGLNDQAAPFGKVDVIKAYTFSAWLNNKSSDYDMALLIIEKSIGYQTGWAGMLAPADPTIINEEVTITGYPGDKGFKQMWSMTHKIKKAGSERFYYDIDTNGGQSGSGIWINKWHNPYVLGIHTLGGNSGNSGVRLSANKYYKMLEVINATYSFSHAGNKLDLSKLDLEDKLLNKNSSNLMKLSIQELEKGDPSLSVHLAKVKDLQNNPKDNKAFSNVILSEIDLYKSLALSKSDIAKLLKNISQSLTLSNLPSFLNLYGNIGVEGAKYIAQSPMLSNLTHLDLSNNNTENEGVKYISQSPILVNLTSLSLDGNSIGSEGAKYLSQSTTLSNLTYLSLVLNSIENEGVKYISQSPILVNLTSLALDDNSIGSDGAKYLSQSTTLSNLTYLNLSNNRICTSGAKYLSQSTTLSNLKSLSISRNYISSEAIGYISQSLNLYNLTYLDLSDNIINDEGAEYIINQSHNFTLVNLEKLYLRDNNITNDVKRALNESATLNKIKYINL